MSKSSRDTRAQHARFIETARALGADEDEAAFKAKLAVIARQKPKEQKREAGTAGSDHATRA